MDWLRRVVALRNLLPLDSTAIEIHDGFCVLMADRLCDALLDLRDSTLERIRRHSARIGPDCATESSAVPSPLIKEGFYAVRFVVIKLVVARLQLLCGLGLHL